MGTSATSNNRRPSAEKRLGKEALKLSGYDKIIRSAACLFKEGYITKQQFRQIQMDVKEKIKYEFNPEDILL